MKKMPEKRLRVKVNKCPVKMDIILITAIAANTLKC